MDRFYGMYRPMGTRELLLILISFSLGLWCIHRIRLLDRYEPEPLGKMIPATLVGGACAVGIALGLYDVLRCFGVHTPQAGWGALVVIGPVEEMAKLAGLVAIYPFIRRELNEPADGLIYMSCVALGFSLIENYLYAVAPDQAYLILIRTVGATPLHIIFSALMGLSFYLWIQNRRLFHLIITAYLLAGVSHGLYDLIVFRHDSIVLLAATVFLMYGFARNLFVYAVTSSPHRRTLAQTIAATGASAMTAVPACLNCDNRDARPVYRIGGTGIEHCPQCDHFNISENGLYRLFFYFSGQLRQTAKKYLVPAGGDGKHLTLFEGNRLCPELHRACFALGELDGVLEKLNYITKARLKSKWYLPNQLYRMVRPGVGIDYPRMARDGRTALWRWLAFPFSHGRRRAPRPPDPGPVWNWHAFFVPELWYAIHRIWGAALTVAGIYIIAVYSALAANLPVPLTLSIAALTIRTASGLYGSRIYYGRHGQWP